MDTLNIRQMVGENCITLEDGQRVYETIQGKLADNRVIALDFGCVNIVASPFLNAAVGQLLRNYTADELRQLVKFENLDPFGESILRRVIKNAKLYYSVSDERRKAVDNILEEQSESD